MKTEYIIQRQIMYLYIGYSNLMDMTNNNIKISLFTTLHLKLVMISIITNLKGILFKFLLFSLLVRRSARLLWEEIYGVQIRLMDILEILKDIL